MYILPYKWFIPVFVRFLLSGSSCGNAFIWDTKNALDPPILLSGHTKEVTAVSWAPNQFDKVQFIQLQLGFLV